jgi:hypothetical protein
MLFSFKGLCEVIEKRWVEVPNHARHVPKPRAERLERNKPADFDLELTRPR